MALSGAPDTRVRAFHIFKAPKTGLGGGVKKKTPLQPRGEAALALGIHCWGNIIVVGKFIFFAP